MECLQDPAVEESSSNASECSSRQDLPSILELKVKLSSVLETKDKIEMVLSFMSSCVSDPSKPRFREFWDSKKIFLELLQSDISDVMVNNYGRICKELSRDALILKENLNKQSNFAVEQIEIAIDAIKSEIGKPNEIPEDWDSSALPEFISDKASFYFDAHSKLLRLSALTDRIVALRNDVLSISMRGRSKKKLLVYLSEVGNVLFPEKRVLSKTLSDQFMDDVKKFEVSVLEGSKSKTTSFLLSEVRKFQALAKELHLTRQIFRNARTILSGCWDKLSSGAKNFKKGPRGDFEKEGSYTKFVSFSKMISDSILAYDDGQLNDDSLEAKLVQIQKDIRSSSFTIEHLKSLKKMLKDGRSKVFENREKEAEKRREEEREAQANREKALAEIKISLNDVISRLPDMEVVDAESEYEKMCSFCNSKSLWKSERLVVDKLLKQIKNSIDDKKRANIIASSDFDQDSTDSLKDKLMQLYSCRDEVKERLAANKKVVGSSGLDFEKAIYLSEMIDNDKGRLLELKKVISSLEMTLKERGAL